MFGPNKAIKRFRFAPLSDETDVEFDAAIKAINAKYAESGRYQTEQEVIDHFKRYGFGRVAI